MEEKKDPWESFQTVGGQQRGRRGKLIVWILIAAAIAGGAYYYLFAS